MLYAILKLNENYTICRFLTYEQLYNYTWTNFEILLLIDFNRVGGHDYEEKKEYIRYKAKTWQENFKHIYNMNDLLVITEYFTKMANRFRLLKEFRENAII
jgi:hypothetical protein